MRAIVLPPSASPDPELVLWAGGSQLLARLLQGRGITARDQVEQLLEPLSRPEPALGDYPPLQQAVVRIGRALAEGERMAVYGDYDVDGITATAVLVTALSRLGANVTWHIPNRFGEGYGINADRVRKLAEEGVTLIITCDCGVSNNSEIALANQLGIDVIVTDHHTLPDELPPALALINFKALPTGHPSRDLPGVGTAFVLARELLQRDNKGADDLLDLVALGIIADVVPLTGHNRQLYAKGIKVLVEGRRPGVAALCQVAGMAPETIDEEKIAFQLAPRLNAAGRLEDGALAVELLLAEDEGRARVLAQRLDNLNTRRKELGREILADLEPEPGQALVAYNPSWHQGVIGIAAGQICSSYLVPAVLMTDARQGGVVVGSARSLPGIDIYAVLKECSQLLAKFGGHPAAAGFSLAPENVRQFCHTLAHHLQGQLAAWKPPALSADLVLEPGQVSLAVVDELRRLAPFGEGNPPPLIFCAQLMVKSVREVNSGHILTLGDHRHSFSAGLWNQRVPPRQGEVISAAMTLAQDSFRGERTVWATLDQWQAQDAFAVRPAGPRLTDCRGLPWQSVLKKYPAAAVFREGVEWLDRPGFIRSNLPPSQVLILLTPPTAPAILEQVVAMAGPAEVVLAYSSLDFSSFFRHLAGAMKYCINQLGGQIGVGQLAAALGHTEQVVVAGLEAMAQSGTISFQLQQGRLHLEQGPGPSTIKASPRLRELLREEMSFCRWLLRAEPEVIGKILK